MKSLVAWLLRHGQHTRSLRLETDVAHDVFDDGMGVAVVACLSVAGARGQLEELSLRITPDLHTDWLLAVRSITRLCLSGYVLQLSAEPLAGLTALQSLELCGECVFDEDARLPTSITRLAVERDATDDMPPQASMACMGFLWCTCACSVDAPAAASARVAATLPLCPSAVCPAAAAAATEA